jgi:hypothetical protein
MQALSQLSYTPNEALDSILRFEHAQVPAGCVINCIQSKHRESES